MAEETANGKAEGGAAAPGDSARDGRTEYPRFDNNRELLLYLYIQIKQQRKWWLFPILMVLAFLALFISLTSGNSSILPAIYAIF
ncbi:MAG: DUF5989 family protein [bacterium]